jgi:putative DNA primase/helicase
MTYPKDLMEGRQWICWRLTPDKDRGKERKVPFNPKTGKMAASNKPETWTDYETAKDALARYGFTGLGFVFTKDDGLIGVDIDHCYDADSKEFNETAKAILAKEPTYAEFSPSGTGVHLFLKGTMPEGGNKNSSSGVEMYGSLRYFTMTGNKVPGHPNEIADDHGCLKWIHDTYIKQTRKSKKTAHGKKRKTGKPLDDEELLEKAQGSMDAKSFNNLWEGKWQEEFSSQSEADLALCCKLAFWSGKDKEQMDRLFRNSGLMRDKWDVRHHASGATYGEETINKAIEATEKCYSTGGDNPVFEYNGCYFRAKGESIYPITNFVVKPVEMVISDDETILNVNLVTTKGETYPVSFQSTDFANQQKFKSVLNRRTIALCYHGTEGDLELLKGYINDLEWDKKTGVRVLGIHQFDGQLVFASPEGVIAADGKTVPGMVLSEKQPVTKTEILKNNFLTKEQLLELGRNILSYNEPAKTVSLLAWTSGCFIKEHLRMRHVKFPHLMLIGEAGSGKSNTLERIILPIFSSTKVVAAGQTTNFTLMKEASESNIIPLALDEFKPSKLSVNKINALYDHFRNSYDGHLGSRGRADQSLVNYSLLAPLVVAGEEAADEAAIRERSVELLFSKVDLKETDHQESFRWMIANTKYLGSLGRSLLESALGTTIDEARKWHQEGRGLFDKALPARITDNLACCYAGLCLLEKLCMSHGLSWQEVYSYPIEACTRHLEYAAREYLLDGKTSNKSVVEQTFEVMARMGLDPNSEYEICDDGATLAIWLNHVYDKFTKYKKDFAVIGEALPYGQFKKQLLHSEYHKGHNVQKRIGSENRRVWLIDYSKLKEKCDAPGFEITEIKPI